MYPYLASPRLVLQQSGTENVHKQSSTSVNLILLEISPEVAPSGYVPMMLMRQQGQIQKGGRWQ